MSLLVDSKTHPQRNLLLECLKKSRQVLSLCRVKTMNIDHASDYKTCLEHYLEDLAKTLLSEQTNVLPQESLRTLKGRKISSLEYLDLELPIFPSLDGVNGNALCALYSGLTRAEQKAKKIALERKLFLLIPAILNYFVSFLDLLNENKALFKTKKVIKTPSKTMQFILDGLSKEHRECKQLGTGAFGDLYIFDTMRTSFALKTAKKTAFHAKSTLINEAVKLLELEHPNLVTLDCFSKQELFDECLILELIPGHSLYDFLGKLECDYPTILEITKQMAVAVGYLHNQGYSHGDLKPQNVMVTSDKKVKLIDFGLAKHKDERRRTQGTHGFMAPELYTSDLSSIDLEKIDVWAFGVTLFSIITSGKTPYPRLKGDKNYPLTFRTKALSGKPNIDELILNYGEINLRIAKNRDPKKQLRSLIAECLHPNPSLRPTMHTIESQIEELIKSFGSFCVIS